MQNKALIVFDFDGTLVKFDTTRLYVFLFSLRFPIKSFIFIYKKKLKYKTGQLSSELLRYILIGKNINSISIIIRLYKFIVTSALNNKLIKEMNRYSSNENYKIIIASASPEFLIKAVFKNIDIIAHIYEIKNGIFTGNNINKRPFKEEKLNQVIEYMKLHCIKKIYASYSDSLNDIYLLNAAENAYYIKNNKIYLYKNEYLKYE